jgi:membrane protein implicated in regulation of membrane protease activity
MANRAGTQPDARSGGRIPLLAHGVLFILVGAAALAALFGATIPGLTAWTIGVGAAFSLLLSGVALVFMRPPSERAKPVAPAARNGTRTTTGQGRLFESVLTR